LRSARTIRENSSLGTPEFDESSAQALHRIRLRQRNGENSIVGGRPLALIAPQEIGTLADRITPDDVKVWTTPEVLMPDPGWNHNHVSRFNVRTNADRMAKANQGMPTINAEHLVRGTVVMRERIYAIAPSGSPLVSGIERFDQVRGLFSARPNCSLVNEQRQPRIVRYLASIGELMSFDLTHSCSRKIIETSLGNQGKIGVP
jgi:hypothetical protein